MHHNVPPRTEASIWVYRSDLETGSGLYGLVAAAARSLGRPIDSTATDIAAAVDVAQRLLVAVGLVAPPPPPEVPDGVEGMPLGGRHT